MKHLAVLGLALLFGTLAAAQTCTPVRISKNYTTKDDGTGPYMSFQLGGTYYTQESTYTTSNATIPMGPVQFNGWVDVFSGFGGCLQSWNIGPGYNYYYQVYDLTIGKYVYTSQTQSPARSVTCGKVAACSFSPDTGIFLGNVTLTHGHSYHYWAYIQIQTSVGTTAYYGDWVKIVVN